MNIIFFKHFKTQPLLIITYIRSWLFLLKGIVSLYIILEVKNCNNIYSFNCLNKHENKRNIIGSQLMILMVESYPMYF